jgi:hypothetical protein
VGVNPGHLTLRELAWMAEARSKLEWSQTSSLLALLANAHRNAKKHPSPFKPADFNPHTKEQDAQNIVVVKDIRILKRLFVDGTKGNRGS